MLSLNVPEPSVSKLDKTEKIAPNINWKFLYGGSINSKNSKKLKTINNLDGFLIGKASLDFAELEKIVIDPKRCPLAGKEFINYALDINRNGDIISKYPDRDNHAIDMTRYACINDIRHIHIPITNIRGRARI